MRRPRGARIRLGDAAVPAATAEGRVGPKLLTIGQLADHCGVTVRAVRHYHQRGLLPEPARDGSGYRRYDAQAVLDLIRIKALSDAGVPLAEVRALLEADEAEFAGAVGRIDEKLRARIEDLEERRKQLAGLLGGDRLVLPDEVLALLEELRALRVSDWTVAVERDGWIMLAAVSAELARQWGREKLEALADPEFRRLYVACDEARDWEPDDPRLEELATAIAAYSAGQGRSADHHRAVIADESLSVVEHLMTSLVDRGSASFRRLGELARSIAEAAPAPSGARPDG